MLTMLYNDPWLTGNIHQQNAIEAMSTAVNTLAAPKVSIGLGNACLYKAFTDFNT